MDRLFQEEDDCTDSELLSIDLTTNRPVTLEISLAENDFNKEKRSLFANYLWHGSRVMSDYLIKNKAFVVDKTVLELGSGVGLPSLTCYYLNANVICASDYKSDAVINNLKDNITRNVPVNSVSFTDKDKTVLDAFKISDDTAHSRIGEIVPDANVDNDSDTIAADAELRNNYANTSIAPARTENARVHSKNQKIGVVAHNWGEEVSELLDFNEGHLYDVIIAAECLWHHDFHRILLTTIDKTLKSDGKLLVTFSHHIAGVEQQDLNFFELAKEFGFATVSKEEFVAPKMWQDANTTIYLHLLVKKENAECLSIK